MRIVLNPCMCEVYRGNARAFVKVEFDNGRLSISGVIGPMANGNCKGSAGQCVDEIRNGTPVNDWTPEMLKKLCDIWDEWHLNDMRPYCEHQKALGWDKLASKEVKLYNYTLNSFARDKQKEAKNAAMKALRHGETFTPTAEQVKYACLSYGLVLPEEISGELAAYYEPKHPLYMGDKSAVETKLLGWLREDEHPEGLLGRACPVCGYRYGHEWKTEEVPPEVIDWLFNLPETKVEPAWV